MRLSIVIMVCSIGTMIAAPSFSQQTKLDVSYNRETLGSVPENLEKRSGWLTVLWVVPYVLESEKNLIVEYERGTVEYVYSKINEDIEDALPHVRKINQTVKKYHWNKEAAYAFAGRFNLYYKQYKKAIDYFTIALGDNPGSSLRNWRADGANAFNVDIACNQYIAADQTTNYLLIPTETLWGRISGPYKLGVGMAMQSITMSEIAPNATLPVGGGLLYSYNTYLAGAKVILIKIKEYFEYFDKLGGIGWTHIVQPVFTADIALLERAEAYALSGDLDLATADLDTFVKAFTYYKAGNTTSKEVLIAYYEGLENYDPLAYFKPSPKKAINLQGLSDDQKNVLHGILHAKRMLTVHEGHRWFDIRRYDIEIYRRIIEDGNIVLTDRLPVGDKRRTFQIPQQMVAAGIEANPR